DLARISILRLADQYLDFVARAQNLRLELAADYLVMAAWLAYLKSRLLLPPPQADSTPPTAEQMAEALAFQLRRLAAMQVGAGGHHLHRPAAVARHPVRSVARVVGAPAARRAGPVRADQPRPLLHRRRVRAAGAHARPAPSRRSGRQPGLADPGELPAPGPAQ